jgi:mRNA interferase RelE/StbE
MDKKLYTWNFTKDSEKQFAKLDKPIRQRILKWLNTNIEGSENPRLIGGALEGDLKNYWRYRVGKYRILADIQDGIFTVLVVKVSKRSDVYN